MKSSSSIRPRYAAALLFTVLLNACGHPDTMDGSRDAASDTFALDGVSDATSADAPIDHALDASSDIVGDIANDGASDSALDALIDAGADIASDAPTDAALDAIDAAVEACASLPDGSSCDDGNACTQTDSCNAGLCVGANPVVCTASDQCHAVGLCNSSSGLCTDPPVPNGSSCDDGNACTQTDACQTGACVGSNPITCTALDSCHGAGSCAAATGCTNPVAPDGTACPFTGGAGGCLSGTCVSQCNDLRTDGAETDVDCGGGTCSNCSVGRRCRIGSDCASAACDAVTLICVASQCTDHVRDGAETDVDCGGGTCPSCAVGNRCALNTDCGSNACDAVSLTCVSSQCNDHHRDGTETDIDCGGGTCSSCVVGRSCTVDTDCVSNACDAISFTCVSSQCSDHRRDGTETDIDCGGGTCTSCAIGNRCTLNTDCVSNACNAVTLTCASSQCVDNRRDGAETDIDCGGGICTACAIGKGCGLDTDCSSSACDGITLTCVASQCIDHRQDGTETDVDCGGTNACSRCLVGVRCLTNFDCQAGHACSSGALHLCL